MSIQKAVRAIYKLSQHRMLEDQAKEFLLFAKGW